MPSAFETCIREQMQRKRFGEAKANAIVKRFNGLHQQYRQAGVADPELQAMTQAFDEFHQRIAVQAGVKMANLTKSLDHRARIRSFSGDPALAVRSMISQDQRAGGLSYAMRQRTVAGQIWTAGGDVMEHTSKGVLGRQRGKAYMDNVVREIFGQKTGDRIALEVATGASKMFDLGVDLFNSAAGADVVRKLKNYFPQRQSAAKLIKAGREKWKQDMGTGTGWLDWSKMFHPDGSPILPSERDAVLNDVFLTLSTGGANKVDPSGGGSGFGASLHGRVDEHRFLAFRDADAWLAMHKAYGEGTVLDVINNHVQDLAHDTALVQTFGTNPQMAFNSAKQYAIAEAADRTEKALAAGIQGRTDLDKTRSKLKLADIMFNRAIRHNPMDPNSKLGAAVTSINHLMTSALLGSTSFLAIPGDFVTLVGVKSLHGMGLNAPVGAYLATALTDKTFMRQMAQQYGFIYDELISSHYAAARFDVVNTYAPAWATRISDTVLRGSFLSGHTNRIKWVAQMELMGHLARERGKTLDQMAPDFAHMLRRNGITDADWNAFRALTPDTPKGPDGPEFLAPIQLTKSSLANRDELFQKFQGLVFQESTNMIPEGTIESAARLKGDLRPDTLVGAVATSFATYKSFPMSYTLIMGRLALSSQRSNLGKAAWIAGMVAGMYGVGALGVQLREVAQGRDPMPMNTTAFMTRALTAGGGFGILGDLLFSAVQGDTSRLPETVAGPLAGFLAEGGRVLGAAAQDSMWLAGAEGFERKGFTADDALVNFAKRYTPGSSLWWARLALQRQVFDRLAEVADPKAYKKRRARAKRQYKLNGNESWWGEGDRMPTRAPSLEGLWQ